MKLVLQDTTQLMVLDFFFLFSVIIMHCRSTIGWKQTNCDFVDQFWSLDEMDIKSKCYYVAEYFWRESV